MGAIVQFLNVGWGDAHLIRLPSGALTLIDGGDGAAGPDRDHPVAWMERHGAGGLDWMILTHIHEDHQNGLIDIARRFAVKRAILPYPLPRLSFGALLDAAPISPLAARVIGMLRDYETLVALLRQQGTDIRWRADYDSDGSSAIWEEAGCTLDHLYPWRDDPLPGLALLRGLSGEDEAPGAEGATVAARTAALEAYFARSNDDSSVYRLACAAEPSAGVLFGGDQLEAGWRRLASRTDLRSRVWKVPHHGMADALGAETLAAIDPQVAVVPIDLEGSHPLRERWDRLRAESGAVFRLTGATPPGESLRLTGGPIETWIGDFGG